MGMGQVYSAAVDFERQTVWQTDCIQDSQLQKKRLYLLTSSYLFVIPGLGTVGLIALLASLGALLLVFMCALLLWGAKKRHRKTPKK